jgi:peptidyl-prolyl cis-trans isomerase D
LLGKIIMGTVVTVLIGAFGIWGINDIFRGFGASTAAKVGRTEISLEQFRQVYNERLSQIGNQLGRPITPDQARALGFDRQILAQMTAEIALDQRARALGLGLSEAEVARRITSDPTFRLPNGQFDAVRFQQAIRAAGFTEQRYIDQQRRNAVRVQLTGTVTAGPIVPNAAIEVADRFENEERSIDYVLLDHAQAGEIEAPSQEALQQYFNDRKIVYRAPEYRKAEVVTLIPSELANTIEVSDQDAKEAYQQQPGRFGAPEQRQVQQILFPNATDAATAADAIAKGAGFADTAKEHNLEVIDLGMAPKAAIGDPAVANAAFALKEGETSAPVEGRFGTVLVHVAKIEPAQYQSYEEASAEVKKVIALERAKAGILTTYDKIEDERSEGHSLAEAAADLKLTARTINADRSGRDPMGEPAAGLPDVQRLMAAVFSTDVGIDADPLRLTDGYAWYEVQDITPARDRTLDEVRGRVEADWRESEIAKRLKAKADAVFDRAKGGTSLADAAAADGLKVQSMTGIKRTTKSPPLSDRAIDAIFRTAKDGVDLAAGEAPGDQLVFRVTEVTEPVVDLKSDASKAIADNLLRSMTEDVYAQFVNEVQNKVGVTVNQAAINQMLNGGNNNDVGDDNGPF